MPHPSRTLKFKQLIRVPQVEVYRAMTRSMPLRDWLCDLARSDPRPGGRLYLEWGSGYYVIGAFEALVPGKKIAFSWQGRGEPARTRVVVRLEEKEGHTLVILSHEGLGSGKKWAGVANAIQAGWAAGLENLQSVLELGMDQRGARLPRLGILSRERNPENAVGPVQGVRLEGTVEGTGARTAGLQKDDIIVRIAGRDVFDGPSIAHALKGRRAGERVDVIISRKGRPKRMGLELSPRPVAEVPATPVELVQIARKNYAVSNHALVGLLKGVTEPEAEYRCVPDAWNIKEIIAHLIACERDYQSWVADMVNDNDSGDSLEYRPNVTPRLRAIVSRFGTVRALIKELESSQRETLDFIADLPPDFVVRRYLYRRAASWAIKILPEHWREEHSEQTRTSLEAARARQRE